MVCDTMTLESELEWNDLISSTVVGFIDFLFLALESRTVSADEPKRQNEILLVRYDEDWIIVRMRANTRATIMSLRHIIYIFHSEKFSLQRIAIHSISVRQQFGSTNMLFVILL